MGGSIEKEAGQVKGVPCLFRLGFLVVLADPCRMRYEGSESDDTERRTSQVKDRRFFCTVLIIVALAFCGCAFRAVKTTEAGDPRAGKRVLIATQQSEFKEAVVSKIVEDLKKDLCYVRVIDLKRLEDQPAADFGAIVVVNTCKAWSLSRGASKFVKRFPDKDRVVLLTTAGGEDWKPKSVEVDAITSASKAQKADPVAEEIVGKVRKILSPDNPPP